MQQEQNEDFETCEFVVNARAERAKKESSPIGFCCVCKTSPLKMNGKDYKEEENGERDGWGATDFDGETCRFCNHAEDEHPSIKCDKCTWPMACSLSTKKKKGADEHGFCQPCIDTISKGDPAEAFDQFEIPMRADPGDPVNFVERDHFHPFSLAIAVFVRGVEMRRMTAAQHFMMYTSYALVSPRRSSDSDCC
jgi:hypothetical protein